MKRTPTYDPKCEDLAAAFLADEENWFEQPLQYREKATARLAVLIQQTIEDEIQFTVRPEILK